MLILMITFQFTENISFCSKHSNNWKKVTYPYFSASSLASSSFTILWSSRSLLFPHNTMSGFSQYACICSWPGSTNMKRGHKSVPHTAPWEHHHKPNLLSPGSQHLSTCTEEPENRWASTVTYPVKNPRKQKPGKVGTETCVFAA